MIELENTISKVLHHKDEGYFADLC